MISGINWLLLLVLLVVLVLIIGTPTCLLVFGIRRQRRLHSTGAKIMIGIGVTICLAYLVVIVSHIVVVGPYRSGILTHGTAPSGAEYCVVQTYKRLGLIGEPYQVSFYMRDADQVWRGQYLAHQDNGWRNVTVVFSDGKARVSHRGYPFKELALPTERIDTDKMREGYDYVPASYSAEDVLKWHNTTFAQ